MAIIEWPLNVAPRALGFHMRGMTVQGPRTLTGRSQVASLDAGFWTATMRGLNVGGAARVKAWRAFIGLVEGGANAIRVPVFDREQIPWPVAGTYAATSTGFDDGTTFTDGTGFYERVILITINGAAAKRATQIGATIGTAGTIAAGVYFSIKDRLHVIREVVSTSGSDQTWNIWPPLREAVADNAVLDFDAPACLMRFVSDPSTDLDLTYGRFGFPDIELVEVLP